MAQRCIFTHKWSNLRESKLSFWIDPPRIDPPFFELWTYRSIIQSIVTVMGEGVHEPRPWSFVFCSPWHSDAYSRTNGRICVSWSKLSFWIDPPRIDPPFFEVWTYRSIIQSIVTVMGDGNARTSFVVHGTATHIHAQMVEFARVGRNYHFGSTPQGSTPHFSNYGPIGP